MSEESINEAEPLLPNRERSDGVSLWGAIFIGTYLVASVSVIKIVLDFTNPRTNPKYKLSLRADIHEYFF